MEPKDAIKLTQPHTSNNPKFQSIVELSISDPEKVISNFATFIKLDTDFNVENFRKTTKRMNKEGQRCFFDVVLGKRFLGSCGYVNINKIDRDSHLVFIIFEENKKELSGILLHLLDEVNDLNALSLCKKVVCKIDTSCANMQIALALLIQLGFYRSHTYQSIVIVVYDMDEQRNRNEDNSESIESTFEISSYSSLGTQKLSSGASTMEPATLPNSSAQPLETYRLQTDPPFQGRSFLRRENWPAVPLATASLSSLNQPVLVLAPPGGSLPRPSTPFSMQACKYFPLGICMFGDNCKYKHDYTQISGNNEVGRKLVEEPATEVQSTQNSMLDSPMPGEMPHSAIIQSPYYSVMPTSSSTTTTTTNPSVPMVPQYPLYQNTAIPYTMVYTAPSHLQASQHPYLTVPSGMQPHYPTHSVFPRPASVVAMLSSLALNAPVPTAQEADFLNLINKAQSYWISRVQYVHVALLPSQMSDTVMSKTRRVLSPQAVDALLCYRRQLQSGLTCMSQIATIIGITAIPGVSIEESLLQPNQELVTEYLALQNKSTAANHSMMSAFYGSFGHSSHPANTVPRESNHNQSTLGFEKLNVTSEAKTNDSNRSTIAYVADNVEDASNTKSSVKEKKQRASMIQKHK